MLLYQHIDIPHWQSISQRFEHLMPNVKGQRSAGLSADDLGFVGDMVLPSLCQHTGQTHTVKTGIIFAQSAGSVQEMHVDGFSTERKGACDWALNIPIASVGEMSWYGGDYELAKTANGQGLGYLEPVWKTEMRLLDSVSVDRPTIVKINVPHQVINHSTQRRLVLSLRFTPDIY